MEILRPTLALLERRDGPVILEDFPKDAPGQGNPENLEGMVCPIPLKKPKISGQSDLVESVLEETVQLAPWQSLFSETHKRTTVGVCKLGMQDAIRFLGDLLQHQKSDAVPQDQWGQTLRFATEDLRNFYLEAAAMHPGGNAAMAELVNWFWGETSAGALLLALHPMCINSQNDELRRVADTLLIPRAQHHRL